MLSVLSFLISAVLDWAASTGNKVKEKERVVKVVKAPKEKTFNGIVTSVNDLERYGIINRSVYFNFDTVYSNRVLCVGDNVLVRASRDEPFHAWSAYFVEFVHKRKPKINVDNRSESLPVAALPKKEMSRIESIEQIVLECNGKHGKLKDGFAFSVEDGEIDFSPVVGDVVTVTVCYSHEKKKVTSWKPKEIKCIDGEVTAFENDCGVVNDEIMFFHNSCRKKVRLYVGQKVSAMIVSSKQGLFQWRAFSLSTSCDNDDSMHASRKPYVDNFEGVNIVDPLDFENISLGHENCLEVIIINKTPSVLVLIDCRFQNQNSVFYLSKKHTSVQTIPESSSLSLTIHCKSEGIGQHEDSLLFEFSNFILKRHVYVTVVDPLQHILKPTAPFSRKSKSDIRQLDSDSLVIIPGRKPYKPVTRFTNKLPPCNIPRSLIRAVQNREDLYGLVPALYHDLTMNSYVAKFRALLHLEEIQVRTDMKKFDMSESSMQRKGEYLSLEVAGLAEGRPSLIVGDKTILVPPYNSSNFAFEGCIHEVRLNEVLMKFSDSFHNSYSGESFDVRFELNRTNFRRLHQCVHHVSENHEYAIFPTFLQLKKPLINFKATSNSLNNKKRQKVDLKPASDCIKWKNNKLNWKQKEAVLKILECQCRPLPYIIFGPPGTGKTVTLVEAVLQVYENIQSSRIIICTPSNSAADLVAQRIIENNKIDVSEMVRLNSYQRREETIPDFIKPYCQDKDSLDYVTQYRIIISTCSTAGSLYTIGLCNDFFTHVFIDEAGQLMEPESAIAVGFLDSQTEGQVVMAGDPQQLGPVLRSSYAVTYGLQVSFLERLMNTALYARNEVEYEQYGGYNPLLVTMLEESYRSHPNILRFPSETFYFSQVKCCFPTDKKCELSEWKELPTIGFPVIFHGIKGEEFREENSPSWFNPTEVVQVTKYLQKLYGFGLVPDDVGIIAPYKKQVEKIRLLLTALSLDFCKIGSVEEFQGQERKAIIISTVRSSDQYVNCDILYNLGFISNPKRLNVAITRAQELLIVVGNPYVLANDYFWHSFIRYCVINGCYTGCDLPLSFVQNKTVNNS